MIKISKLILKQIFRIKYENYDMDGDTIFFSGS